MMEIFLLVFMSVLAPCSIVFSIYVQVKYATKLSHERYEYKRQIMWDNGELQQQIMRLERELGL